MTASSPIASEMASTDRAKSVELSIIMPCFNEAETIEKVLAEWKELLDEEKISHEIIVVNDGSSDGTGRLLDRIRRDTKGIKVIHQLNSGPSKATRRGYELCRGRFVLHTEASLRYEPLDFIRLWEKREESPCVFAFRTHRLDGILRRLLSRVQCFLLKRLFNLESQDPSVSFRLMRRDIALAALKQIPQKAEALNLWLTVITSHTIAPHSASEVAVPYRRRVSCRIRRKNRSLFSEALLSIREILAMRYGDTTRPGIGKLPAWQAETAA